MLYEEVVMEEVVMENFIDYSVARTHLVLRVSDYATKKKHLSKIPHRRAADLAVTCHFMEMDEDERMSFTVVDQGLLEWMAVSEDQLFSDAFLFGPRNLPPEIHPLGEMVDSVLDGKLLQNEELTFEEQLDALDIRNEALVLTNTVGLFGASSLFYPNILELITERIGRNCFILPSSIHEMILLPDDGDYYLPDLEAMVQEINRTELMEKDWLSDSVYYYDKNRKNFAKAVSVIRI